MIDYAGPWEVFQDVHIPRRGSDHADQMPFELFTVSDTTEIVVGSAGLKIVPNYTFENAPSPKVVVIPAQVAEDDETVRRFAPGARIVGIGPNGHGEERLDRSV